MKRVLISLIILGTAFLSGVEIALGGKASKRFVSLAPSTTEILFALGLNEEIAGVSSFCDYPQQAKQKEKVGDFSRPNIEKIISLKPDYVFCTGLEQTPVISELRRLKLNVYVADPKNIVELLTTIEEIGAITAAQESAQKLTGKMRRVIEGITEKVNRVPQEKRPRVFIEIWNDPLTTAGKDSFIDDIITIAGGINIADDTRRAFSIFSPEEVIARDPDFIILTYMVKGTPLEAVRKRFGWSGIKAVKNNRIINDIEPNLLIRPGPRVSEGLEKLHSRLYPQN